METQCEILCMRRAGAKLRSIVEKSKVPLSTVKDPLRKHAARGTSRTAPRSGRPTKLTARDVRSIQRSVRSNRRDSLPATASNLATLVSRSTLRRTLHEPRFKCCVVVKRPYLTDRHVKARLEFARTHADWTEDDWAEVVWTDESSFEIGANVREIRVWFTLSEKYLPECLSPSLKSGAHFHNGLGCYHREQ